MVLDIGLSAGEKIGRKGKKLVAPITRAAF